MPKRIIHVVTNVAHYNDPSEPTGLWLSELTHAWDRFEVQGYEQVIVSPKGGLSPLEESFAAVSDLQESGCSVESAGVWQAMRNSDENYVCAIALQGDT
jgi:putative intracellular protease/amidase